MSVMGAIADHFKVGGKECPSVFGLNVCYIRFISIIFLREVIKCNKFHFKR